MTYTIDNCQLEVDVERGVVYVHGPNGQTLVRVCKIPTSVLRYSNTIDITDFRWHDHLEALKAQGS